jgi:hypothetical protein
MKKVINYNLYKNIIGSEFFLLNTKNSITSNVITQKLVKNESGLSVLDTHVLLSSLKQFISVLSFFKEKPQVCFNIHVDSLNLFLLLQTYFRLYPLSAAFIIDIKYKFYKQKISKDTPSLLLSINKNSFLRDEKLFKKGFLLICSINNILKMNFNSYSMYNDVFEIKKIIFLVTLIDKIYKN